MLYYKSTENQYSKQDRQFLTVLLNDYAKDEETKLNINNLCDFVIEQTIVLKAIRNEPNLTKKEINEYNRLKELVNGLFECLKYLYNAELYFHERKIRNKLYKRYVKGEQQND